MANENRFQAAREWLGTFGNSELVECLKCHKCAKAVHQNNELAFSCLHCGANNKPWPGGVELWLQVPCCGETLWALNEQHLEFLEKFIGAGLRERRRDETFGWANRSLDSRLPRWMTSAKNREEVMRGLQRLREKLG